MTENLSGLRDALTGMPLDPSRGLYHCARCKAYYHADSCELLRRENAGRCIGCGNTSFMSISTVQAQPLEPDDPVNTIAPERPVVPRHPAFRVFFILPLILVCGVWLALQFHKAIIQSPEPPDEIQPPPKERVMAKKDTISLNVRSEPFKGNNALRIVNLRKGQSLELLDSQGDWYKVRINANGKQVEGWVSRDYFLKKDQILKETATQLAANGYGHVSVVFDPMVAKIMAFAEVKDMVDSDNIKTILSRIYGVASVDIGNVKVRTPPELGPFEGTLPTRPDNPPGTPDAPTPPGRESTNSVEGTIERIRDLLAANELEQLFNVIRSSPERINITAKRGFSSAEATKLVQIVKEETSANPGLVIEVSCSIARRAGQTGRFLEC
jgi:Bacterial SH3 domain